VAKKIGILTLTMYANVTTLFSVFDDRGAKQSRLSLKNFSTIYTLTYFDTPALTKQTGFKILPIASIFKTFFFVTAREKK
jgi:hypothetical protein